MEQFSELITNDELRNVTAAAAATGGVNQLIRRLGGCPSFDMAPVLHAALAASFCAGWDLALLAVNETEPRTPEQVHERMTEVLAKIPAAVVPAVNAPPRTLKPPRYQRGRKKRGIVSPPVMRIN